MTDTYRALCAELVADYDDCHYRSELSDRAHAALAEPEPPADGEVAELVACLRREADVYNCHDHTVWLAAADLHRAADLLERLAEPERPSDAELTLVYACAVAAAVDNKRGPFKPEDAEAAQLAGLRAVLARWGTVSTPLPRTQNEL